MKIISLLLLTMCLSSCSTVGSLGIVARSSDAASNLKNGRPFKELGLTEGRACRYFLLGVIPWGDADIQAATDHALANVGGGDALINVTTQNSLYGFIPIYTLWSQSCTTVKGMAIRFEDTAEGSSQINNKASSQRQKAKEFVVAGYKDIVKDLSKGNGQYLTSLLELLGVPPQQRKEATAKIHALSEAYTNIPDFADHVSDLYIK